MSSTIVPTSVIAADAAVYSYVDREYDEVKENTLKVECLIHHAKLVHFPLPIPQSLMPVTRPSVSANTSTPAAAVTSTEAFVRDHDGVLGMQLQCNVASPYRGSSLSVGSIIKGVSTVFTNHSSLSIVWCRTPAEVGPHSRVLRQCGFALLGQALDVPTSITPPSATTTPAPTTTSSSEEKKEKQLASEPARGGAWTVTGTYWFWFISYHMWSTKFKPMIDKSGILSTSSSTIRLALDTPPVASGLAPITIPQTLSMEKPSWAPYTPRVLLRGVPDADTDEALLHMQNDPVTMAHLRCMIAPEGGFTPEVIVQRRTRWANLQSTHNFLQFCIWNRPLPGEKVECIGCCGLMMIDHKQLRCDLGIIVHHPYWRAGYATEAIYLVLAYGFDVLGLHRVGASTNTENTMMRGFFEKYGWKLEGTKEEFFWEPFDKGEVRGGRWTGMAEYGITQQHWHKHARGQMLAHLSKSSPTSPSARSP